MGRREVNSSFKWFLPVFATCRGKGEGIRAVWCYRTHTTWSYSANKGSRIRIFPSRIPGQKDPGGRTASKNLGILNPKTVSKLLEKWFGMFLPNPNFFIHPWSRIRIPVRGVKKALDPGSSTLFLWIRNALVFLSLNSFPKRHGKYHQWYIRKALTWSKKI